MPAVLKLPIQKKIFLTLDTESDPDQDTYVEVRQATQREVERRAELTADASRIFRSGTQEVEVKQRWSIEEQKRLEVYLTLAGSNIQAPPDSDGAATHSLFRYRKDGGKMVLSMSEAEFNDAWGLLPEEWAEAIHDAVLQVNPQWNPNWKG